jgi:hypothetical protein
MKLFTVHESMQALAKAIGKPCMYISFETSDGFVEIEKAAPYLAGGEYNDNKLQIICDGCGILIFDNEIEMEKYYKMTVGDDGPTKSNSYDGNARVYALTCGADGELQNENT